MNYRTSIIGRRSLRAYAAAFISYLMLVGQVAPLALGAGPRALPVARPASAPMSAAPQPAPVVFAAPVITATKVDSWDDSVIPNGKAEPGQTVTYTVTVSNTGSADATGVTFTDSVDPNTTLVAGSVQTQPIATDDSYNVIGNVRIQPNAAAGLLTNDRDPDTGDNTPLTASGPTTTTQGGNITINGDGSFSYNPAPGFAGTDTVTYTITDKGPDNTAGTGDDKTDTAVATFLVGNGTATPGTNVLWFVNPSAPAGGDGRLTNPFNCYTGSNVPAVSTCFSATAADDPGDIIFLFSGAHTGGNALTNTQKLIGAGATDTLANLGGLTVPTGSDALPSTGGASPTITTTNANAIPLAQNNLLRGFTVGNTGTGTKINGSGFGTLTVGNNGSPDVTLNGTGQALNLNNGAFAATSGFNGVTSTSSATQGIIFAGITGTVSFGSTSVSGSTTQGILIGTTTADINFGNTTVSATTDAISFQNNSGGTRTLGTLNATGGATGIAFLHGAGGGNVTVNGLATLSSATANTVDIQNQAVSTTVNFASGATLTKSAGTNTGINLNTDNGNVTFGGTLTIGTAGARFPTTAVTINGGTGTYSLGTVSIFTNSFAGISATNADGTLNTTGGTVDVNAASALNISGPAGFTTLGITLGTINSTGGTNNVNLTNTNGTATLSGGALSGASGSAFVVSGGNPTVSYAGTLTQNNAGRVVDIQGTTGNSVTFSNTVTGGASSLGVHIGDISAVNGNVTFSTLNLGTAGARMTNQAVTISNGGSSSTYTLGTFAIFTNNANGIGATNFDGTLNCSSTSTVDSSNGTAISIDGPAGLTTLGMSLVSVNSAGGTADGIRLQDTNGSFAVNGDNSNTAVGGNSTGGTISNKSGADNNDAQGIGIYLNNVTNITLRRVTINGTNQNFGIKGFTVNNFTLEYSTVSGTNGTAAGLVTPENYGEGAVYFGNATVNGTTGNVTITNNNINGARKRNFSLVNTTAGTTTLTVKGNTFGVMQNFNDAGSSFAVEARVSSGVIINTTFGGTSAGEPNTLTSAVGDLVNFTGQDQTTMDVVMRNNTLSDNHAFNNSGGGGIAFATKGTMTFHVTGNTMRDANGSAVTFFKAAAGVGTPSMSGFFDSNTIGVAAVAGSGSKTANGIFVSAGGTGTMSYTITNNQIHQIGGNAHIYADNTGGSYTANFDIRGNTLDTPVAPNWAFGMGITNGAPTSGDTINTCAVIGGAGANKNTLNVGAGQIGVIVGASGAAAGHTFNLPGYAGGANLTNVQNFIAANNTMNSSVVSAYNDPPATAAAFTGVGTGCGTPSSGPETSDFSQAANPETAAVSDFSQPIGIAAPVYMTPLAMRLYQMKFGVPYRGTVSRSKLTVDEAVAPTAEPAASAVDTVPTAEPAPEAQQQYMNPAPQFIILPQPTAADEAEAEKKEDEAKSDKPEEATSEQPAPEAVPAPEAPATKTAEPQTKRTAPAGGRIDVKTPKRKAAGSSPLHYAAEDTSAPLSPDAYAQKRKLTAPVLTDAPGGPNGAGGTVSVNIGTLRQSDSVTITFQVVIDNPYSGGPNISNQGTVSGSNFSNVLTDDPTPPANGSADPTLTPINSTDIRINDASVAEPGSGTAQMLFTLTLTQPAGGGGLTVTYNTANGSATGGASCGGLVDYVTVTGGTATVPAGSQTATIPITVCADTDSPEPSETLTVTISSPSSGTIVDNVATGTITQGTTAGTFLISELRTSGPGGAGDDFVEFYNNTNSPLTVASSDASAGYGLYKKGATCNDTPVLIATIPNGTIIPARGHYLVVGSQYTLANYGGAGAAAGNQTMTSDIENDRNVAVFSTATVANISSANRLDAVGGDSNTGAVCDLLREGNNLPAVSGSTTEHSFFRNLCDPGTGCTGDPKDTNDNAADFRFADTQGTFISGVTQRLGAPGPENLSSPIRRDNSGIGGSLLDGSVASSAHPNRTRSFTSNPAQNSTFGTLTVRRRVTNNTGAPVTRLRYRIVDMSTFPSPGGGVADLRAITSVDEPGVGPINDATTCANGGTPATPPCTVTARGTTLEQPPNQPNGGGINSSLSSGTVTLATPLANNASINVRFVLGIQTTGTYRFYIIIEALP
ncbi:MAG: trimeric autotransporter adhesin [Acidobacteriota bacterium]|jgi:hypothetical protein|nr:trimeric autotransporter adhesin [Acidobacteriota bacterium]